jgi:hypothetical protein
MGMRPFGKLGVLLLLVAIPILSLVGCAAGPAGEGIANARIDDRGHLS